MGMRQAPVFFHLPKAPKATRFLLLHLLHTVLKDSFYLLPVSSARTEYPVLHIFKELRKLRTVNGKLLTFRFQSAVVIQYNAACPAGILFPIDGL